MKVYKFKDIVDGRYAFIIAKAQSEAVNCLRTQTSIEFKFIESRDIESLNRPIIIYNNILPF